MLGSGVSTQTVYMSFLTVMGVEIHNGSTVDDALFACKSITIVGEGPGESFKFNFDKGTVTRTENVAPYALMGDLNGDLSGGLTLNPGSHTLVYQGGHKLFAG